MSEAKFTKGPWSIDRYGNINANGDVLMVRGVKIPCGYAVEETDANVSLIAAAPEMYAMLETFLEALDRNGEYASTRCQIYDLLAKARGKV